MTKLSLATATAACALGIGLAASPAAAFDDVDWVWNKDLTETITKNIFIESTIVPTGLVEVEDFQIQIGDVTANSHVHDIYNNQPSQGGDGTIDFTVTYSDDVDDSVDPSTFEGPANLGGDLAGVGNVVGETDEGADTIDLVATFEDIAITLDASDIFDAETELPTVISAATAVGNNANIYSETMVEVHEGQFLFDVCGECGEGTAIPIGLDGSSIDGEGGGNLFHDTAGVLAVAAALRIIDSADVTATSHVHDILNAAVDSTATAVGNNKSITVEAPAPEPLIAIADITQFAFADVSATSHVHDVTLNNYTGLGNIDTYVSSVATAVGNNLNITVGRPTVPPPVP